MSNRIVSISTISFNQLCSLQGRLLWVASLYINLYAFHNSTVTHLGNHTCYCIFNASTYTCYWTAFNNSVFPCQTLFLDSGQKNNNKIINSQPWFMSECVVAIDNYNYYYYNISHREQSSRILDAFRTVHNHCKRVIGNAKCSCAQAVQAQVMVKIKILRFGKFWKISNQNHNRGKVSVPTIINVTEVISSLSDKTKLFTINFVSNSTLDNNGHLLSWSTHFVI